MIIERKAKRDKDLNRDSPITIIYIKDIQGHIHVNDWLGHVSLLLGLVAIVTL
jgi:hypothetical protein